MKSYSTSEVAEIIGVHPNTVRLYEQWGLIPEVKRAANGYRIFTEFHIAVFKLARLAFQIEITQSGLRKKITSVIKSAAVREFDTALLSLEQYRQQLKTEQDKAREAILITEALLVGQSNNPPLSLKRKEAAHYLNITIDTLRNWELNGLIQIKRTENRYRVYSADDLARLKIIRTLRYAGYSLEAILRLLNELPDMTLRPRSIESRLDTPRTDDDIISVCDNLLTSLERALENSAAISKMLEEIINKF